MSDSEETTPEKPFAVDVAKTGRAACKKCKQKCEQGKLRMAKVAPSPFGAGMMKNWHHVACIFEVFSKQRQATRRIEDPEEDIEGWDDLSDEHKADILEHIKESDKAFEKKFGVKPSKKAKAPKRDADSPSPCTSKGSSPTKKKSTTHNSYSQDTSAKTKDGKDDSFRNFRKLVADITNVSSYTEKTKLVQKMLTKGPDGDGFKGDTILWCRLLLPGVVKRKYNLQSKQLVKLFSKILNCSQDKMLRHLEQGDVAETVATFFEEHSKAIKPVKKSSLTLQDVDDFLEELSKLTKEEEQISHFESFCRKCTANDLKIIIRLIKHDLRMNAGAKHVLDGVHPDAYEAYQSSRDLEAVIRRCLGGTNSSPKVKPSPVKAKISCMTPVLPMLAEACKSVEYAMKKCPNGMYSEIKYDGERVQVHKRGSEFKYFSRSLKPVLPHKVAHFKDYIPQAFPHGRDLILDSEILMVDVETGKPLPFGTLGVHKKSEFKNANVCLFIFDCIYYNGEILTDKPIRHRKKILEEVMTEIPNRIMFSENKEIKDPGDLSAMIAKVLKLGLEGLVLKDVNSVYEPGKRHWLKVKKDYLFGGAMADSADLIVLGAWYGTGKKGGMMSVFLMGCYDTERKKFCTVTKVHTGHDDKTLEKLQTELKMVKISRNSNEVPDWLICTKTMTPDFVAEDPKQQPVWEITGAEFTQHDVHTADGISIRFPRVTKIRDDKDWETATSVQELKQLFKASKQYTDVSLLMKGMQSTSDDGASTSSDKKQPTMLDFVKKSRRSKINSSSDSESNSDTETSTRNSSSRSSRTVKRRISDYDDEDSGIAKSPNKKIKTQLYSSSVEIKNPIPDYFADTYLSLGNGAKDEYSDWIRYFIAYGGVVLKADHSDSATHMLHTKDVVTHASSNTSNAIKHVTVDWIKQSISHKKLLDCKPFIVKWKPENNIDVLV